MTVEKLLEALEALKKIDKNLPIYCIQVYDNPNTARYVATDIYVIINNKDLDGCYIVVHD